MSRLCTRRSAYAEEYQGSMQRPRWLGCAGRVLKWIEEEEGVEKYRVEGGGLRRREWLAAVCGESEWMVE